MKKNKRKQDGYLLVERGTWKTKLMTVGKMTAVGN